MELDEHGAIIYSNDNVNMVGSKFEVQADRIGMVVGTRTTQSGEENYIKAGEIVLSINQSTGASEAKIDAGHVYIGNDKSTTVIAGKLNASDVTANYIQAKISDISILAANALSVAGGINGSGTLTVAGLATLNGSMRFGSGNSFSKCIVNAENDNGTLKLTDSNGNVVNFSRVSLVSGSWTGTTYTAVPNASGSGQVSTSISASVDNRTDENVYMRVYHDTPTSANQLIAKTLALSEDTTNKRVQLKEGSTEKARISTEATYNKGWNDCIDAMGLYSTGGVYYFYKYADNTYLYPAPMTPSGQGQWYNIAAGYGTVSKK